MRALPKRTNKDYGGGTGHEMYASGWFSVTLWRCQNGDSTLVEHSGYSRSESARFEGDVTALLTTDAECVAAFPPSAVLRMLRSAYAHGVREGRNELRESMRELFAHE